MPLVYREVPLWDLPVLAGPYDFIPTEQRYVDIFSAAGGNASSAMPATYVDGTQPPMLLLWGNDDELVGNQNIESVEAKVRTFGGQLEVKQYDGIDHFDILAAFAIPFRSKAPVVDDVVTFFNAHLQRK